MDALDFGRHTLYIVSAYGVSAVTLTVLIVMRYRRLKKAVHQERDRQKNLNA
jgi:heme exporter protein CcmD